jgi:Tfp pilus assembly protein PilO
VQKLLDIIKNLSWRGAIIVSAIGAAYFYFTLDTAMVDELNTNITSLTNEVATVEKKVKEAKDFEAQFEARKKKYVERVKDLQAKQGALPKLFFLPDLLADLLREAKQLELEIVSIQPDVKEEQKNLYSSLGFNLEVRGTFLQTFIFLDRMAHMKRLADVKMFALQRDATRASVALGGEDGVFASSNLGGGKTAFPGVSGTIRVVTYRYRGPTEAPKPAEPAPAAAPAKGKT